MGTFRKLKVMVLLAALLAIPVVYNNCSSSHDGGSTGSNSNNSEFTCDDNLDTQALFTRTYHPFLTLNCAACHSGGGPGPGSFASSGPALAWTSFDLLGFSRINTKSLDGHSPSSGAQHTATIQSLTQRYVDGLEVIERCKGGGSDDDLTEDQDGPTRVKLVSKAINPDPDGPVQVTWNLQNDSLPLAGFDASQFANIQLTATVEIFERPGILAYVISNPRILTTNGDVHIESLLFKLNGRPTPAQRAFYLVNKDIRAWNSAHPDFTKPGDQFRYQAELVSSGALVMLGEIRTTDVLSVSIGALQRVTLPPPPLGPTVQFSTGEIVVNENVGVVNVTVNLGSAINQQTSAQLTFGPDTTIKDQCCRLGVINLAGQPIRVQHFDRDIQDFTLLPVDILPNNQRMVFNGNGNVGRYGVTFLENETTKTFQIKIVDDNRDEPEEVLHLQFDGATLNGLRPGTANQNLRIRIVDNDGASPTGVLTYQNLLNEGGILSNACLRCHNSVQTEGGYDITNYDYMRSINILIPGNADSKMFVRMNSTGGLGPMPPAAGGGLIDENLRYEVRQWILTGAGNN